jgi:signal peptidase I
MTNSYEAVPFKRKDWNRKNWGPVIVPASGLTMSLDDFTRELYRKVIEYETGKPLEESVAEYTFKKNYYFAVGDNAMSSYDSRYWGFIPEDFIIGIVAGKRFRNK